MGGGVVGDIVMTRFPYTDLSQATMRPALVLASAGMNDWILCQITSSSQARAQDIALFPSDMQSGRLVAGSHVRPERLATLNASVFERTVGRVTDAKQAEVREVVRSLFSP